jgi:hypothetical protein
VESNDRVSYQLSFSIFLYDPLQSIPSHNQERSAFSTDRRLRGRIPIFPTSKEVHKSGETQSHKQSTCSCKKKSPVALDTEKAVEFSQRQMQDVENIAAKLIRSLKHMKTIVDETLSSEAYSGVPNFSIADVRHAIYCSHFKILCSLICK